METDRPKNPTTPSDGLVASATSLPPQEKHSILEKYTSA